jgi:hypothetical protein
MRWILACVVVIAACGGDDNVSRELGARCDVSGDCDDRCLGPSNEFTDGMCSLDCDSNAVCPINSECVRVEGGVCMFTCFNRDSCSFLGPGWACRQVDLQENQQRTTVCQGE